MISGIIDTSILVDCLRDVPGAVDFLSDVTLREIPHTHLMAKVELVAGAQRKTDFKVVDELLSEITVVVPTADDLAAALELLRAKRLSNGVDWADSQIAATALRMNLPVYTRNVKHFQAFDGLIVVCPY